MHAAASRRRSSASRDCIQRLGLQPDTGHHETHGKTGKTIRQTAEKCRQEKKSEYHAIHGSLPTRSDQHLNGWLPSQGKAANSSIVRVYHASKPFQIVPMSITK